MAAFSWVFFARMAAGAASFLCVVLVARSLGPVRFSDFAILLTVMKVAAEFIGPALDTGLVRFAARHIGVNGDLSRDESLPYFRVMLGAKLTLGVAVILMGVLGATPIRDALFGAEAAGEPGPSLVAIPLAFLGAAFSLMWAYAQAYFQAHQRFTRYALYDMANAAARLICVAAVLLAGYSSATAFLGAYVFSQAVLAVGIWSRLPLGPLLMKPVHTAGVGRRLFRFTRWVVLACCFTALGQRADLLLLAYFRVAKEVIGHYAPALQLALLGDLVILTLFNILLPKASKLRTASEVKAFVRRFRLPLVGVSIAMLPAVLLAGPVARLIFGEAYAQTGVLFSILFLGTAFAVACAPASTALYGLGRSHVIAGLEGLRLVALLIIGSYAVQKYGAVGMAWTVTIIKGTIGVASYAAVHWQIRRGLARERNAARGKP
jgi:O-antigen/teichoic acid export membrane protein